MAAPIIGERDAVDVARIATGRGDEGRIQVDQADQVVAAGPGVGSVRPAQDQRHLDHVVVEAVALAPHPVIAEHLAVIRSEDDHHVVTEPLGQRGPDGADLIIDQRDVGEVVLPQALPVVGGEAVVAAALDPLRRRCVQAAVVDPIRILELAEGARLPHRGQIDAVQILLRRVEREVRATDRDPEELRPVPIGGADPRRRLPPDPGVGVPLGRPREGEHLGRGPVPDRIPIGGQVPGGVKIIGIVVAEPHRDLLVVLQIEVVDPQAQVVVTELLVRQRGVRPGPPVRHRCVVTLADVGDVIAQRSQAVVEIRLLRRQPDVPEVAVRPMPVRIAPGHDRRPARKAVRAGRVGLIEHGRLRANASRLGVATARPPKQPSASARNWSVVINTSVGRSMSSVLQRCRVRCEVWCQCLDRSRSVARCRSRHSPVATSERRVDHGR